MPYSNFPNGFNHGVAIRGLPVLNMHAGNAFWVDSGTGLSGDGTLTRPYATIDEAIGKCTANNGDIILVKPGHTEAVTAASGIDFDVAGVTVVGFGSGSDRPTITFGTAITADMDIDAANVTLSNLLFVNGIDNLTAPIDVNAANFTMIDCETRDNNASYHCDDFIQTDANADGMTLDGWVHDAYGGKTGASTAVSIVGGNNIVIIPKWVVGDFGVAAIENVTTAAVNLQIFGRGDFPAYLRTQNAADVIVTLVATSTGRVGPNLYARLEDHAANITTAFVGADMEFFQPIHIVNLDGEVGMPTDITATTNA